MYQKFKNRRKLQEVRDMYRSTFKSKMGQECLAHMLMELGLFEGTEDMDDRALGRLDYASRLLAVLGCVNEPNFKRIVGYLFKLSPSSIDGLPEEEYNEEIERSHQVPRSMTDGGG